VSSSWNVFIISKGLIMHVSTRKGDGGSTDLLRGGRVSKHHQVIEAVGTLDEASSLLGLARASSKEKRISLKNKWKRRMQKSFWEIT
jgi:cob(I)alamin adenosyltransferase